jgi:hypothetical protein
LLIKVAAARPAGMSFTLLLVPLGNNPVLKSKLVERKTTLSATPSVMVIKEAKITSGRNLKSVTKV